MQSRHRRAPSALQSLGFEEEIIDSSNYFASTLQASLPRPQLPQPNEIKYLENSRRPQITNSSANTQKFSLSQSNSPLNEFCTYDKSSNDLSSKEASESIEVCEKIEFDSVESTEIPMQELSDIVEKIILTRNIKDNKLNTLRKGIKNQLMNLFKIEVSDCDTDRIADSVKCSKETIEGPGSFLNMDDFSLVKFDVSVEKSERKKSKSVKFKDI